MQWCLAAHNGRLDSLPYYALSWTLTSISVVEPGKIFSSLSEIIATSLFADRRYLSLVPLTCRSIDYIGTKGLYENSWCVVAEASSQLVTSHKSSHSQIVTALIRSTRADDSGGSKAFIRVCLYVYSSARQNQNGWTIITKLPTDIIHHEATHLILDQKVKGQGHRVTKCKKHFSWRQSNGRCEFALYWVQPSSYHVLLFAIVWKSATVHGRPSYV